MNIFMELGVMKKYRVNTGVFVSSKVKKTDSFFDLAKKHIIKEKGETEKLAINADKILYGKK